MGYRHYFYLVEEEIFDKINNFTEEEWNNWCIENNLEDETSYGRLRNLGTELLDFGKYYDNVLELQKNGKPLFKNKELQEEYEENSPYILGKDALLNVIEFQRNLIVNYYKNMLNLTDEERYLKEFYGYLSREDMYKAHIKSMLEEWEKTSSTRGYFAINLDCNTPTISESWKYEYSIFELVRLYKSTDWGKYGIIFFGG